VGAQALKGGAQEVDGAFRIWATGALAAPGCGELVAAGDGDDAEAQRQADGLESLPKPLPSVQDVVWATWQCT